MATIDYKEKYGQALERARQFREKPYLEDSAGIVEYIFPELKKSEDEEHRKWILEYLYDGLRKSDEQFKDEFKCAIAWLEKQGEQKPNYCHHEVDLSDCSEEYRKAYYDGWNNCNMQHSQCRSELDDVVKCLINGMKFYYEDNEEATWGTDKWSMPVKHIIEVLEKQSKDSPVLSNYSNTGKSVWSEDDDDNMIMIEDSLSDYFDYIREDSTLSKNQKKSLKEEVIRYVNWLKSLKDRVQPQSQWRPSDEQIEALDDAIAICSERDHETECRLDNLRQDLMKLKG